MKRCYTSLSRLRTAGTALLVATATTLWSCDDNEDLRAPEPFIPATINGAIDLANGMNVVMVDLDSPDSFELRLGTKRAVSLATDAGCPVQLALYTAPDTTRTLRITSVGEINDADLPKIYNLHLELEDGSLTKDVKLVLRRKVGVQDVSEYAKKIGQGTKVWADLGNVTFAVLDFDAIAPQLQDNVNTVGSGEHFEIAGSRYDETMEKMSVNVGIAGSSPSIAKKFFMSGGSTFSQEKCTNNINNIEFYLGYYYKVMAEVKLNRAWLANHEQNGTLYALLDTIANDVLNNPGTGAYALYSNDEAGMAQLFEDYGTHVIMQGSFGGNYIYMYGRYENAYEESIGHDASANIKCSQTTGEAARTWLEQYQKKMCSPYISADGDGSDYTSEYRDVTVGFDMTIATGGDGTMDIETWDATIRSDNPGGWALVSYTTLDTQEDHDGHLLPITEFICDPERKAAAEKYMEAYLAGKVKELIEAKLVLADIKMIAADDHREKGTPKPKVDVGPDGVTNYLYFPMMANKHAPTDKGYAMQTHQDEYVVDSGTNAHYWYYALGYDHKCNGFTDIRFDNHEHDDWTRRGTHANDGVVGAINNNYVMIKPGTSTTPYEDKIKAVALMKESDKGCTTLGDRLMASSGGAEFKKPFESSETKAAFDNYWGQGYGRYDTTVFYTGGLVTYNHFYIVYSKNPLPLTKLSFGDGNTTPPICPPTKWGY